MNEAAVFLVLAAATALEPRSGIDARIRAVASGCRQSIVAISASRIHLDHVSRDEIDDAQLSALLSVSWFSAAAIAYGPLVDPSFYRRFQSVMDGDRLESSLQLLSSRLDDASTASAKSPKKRNQLEDWKLSIDMCESDVSATVFAMEIALHPAETKESERK